jgi:carbon-monoxide dehydrogenase medium subunit
MIPYAFHYHRARSLADAEKLFTGSDDAKYLAGGQSLIPALKQRLANPSHLIDIAAIRELSFVEIRGDSVVIGAGTKHATVATSRDIRRVLPALSDLAQTIGDPAVRHMGTLGGSLANNDPAADYPAAALALGASIKTTRRSILSDDFFTGMFSTALEDGEIITDVTFPLAEQAGYAKFPNPASRYALAGVFVARTKDGVRVAVTGAGTCVFRERAMEAALDRNFAPEALNGIAVSSTDLNSDIHASAEYRAHLIGVMARRAVAAATGTV